MASLVNASTLRRLADALQQLEEITLRSRMTLCAYGPTHIEIDGVTLPLQCSSDDDGITHQYVVDLSGA